MHYKTEGEQGHLVRAELWVLQCCAWTDTAERSQIRTREQLQQQCTLAILTVATHQRAVSVMWKIKEANKKGQLYQFS